MNRMESDQVRDHRRHADTVSVGLPAGATVITRPAFRYHGSKWRLAPWIISHFPPHECYVEPFGGNASVLLRKSRSYLETYNDLVEDVVSFFRVLRERPAALVRALTWTPYSKREWELALTNDGDPGPLERARRFYVRSYMGLAGPTAQWRTGWRRQKMITKVNNHKKMTPAAISFMSLDHLYAIADRLRGVQIECDDALAVISRFDSSETLFYLDPPYPSSTRGRWKDHAYEHEMTDQEHTHLAEVLHGLKGKAIVSSYRCDLYAELYSDWPSVARVSRTNSAHSAVERLWLSPNIPQTTLPLFDLVEAR